MRGGPSSALASLALQHHDDGVSHLLGHILYGFAFAARPLALALGSRSRLVWRLCAAPGAWGWGSIVYLLA